MFNHLVNPIIQIDFEIRLSVSMKQPRCFRLAALTDRLQSTPGRCCSMRISVRGTAGYCFQFRSTHLYRISVTKCYLLESIPIAFRPERETSSGFNCIYECIDALLLHSLNSSSHLIIKNKEKGTFRSSVTVRFHYSP